MSLPLMIAILATSAQAAQAKTESLEGYLYGKRFTMPAGNHKRLKEVRARCLSYLERMLEDVSGDVILEQECVARTQNENVWTIDAKAVVFAFEKTRILADRFGFSEDAATLNIYPLPPIVLEPHAGVKQIDGAYSMCRHKVDRAVQAGFDAARERGVQVLYLDQPRCQAAIYPDYDSFFVANHWEIWSGDLTIITSRPEGSAP